MVFFLYFLSDPNLSKLEFIRITYNQKSVSLAANRTQHEKLQSDDSWTIMSKNSSLCQSQSSSIVFITMHSCDMLSIFTYIHAMKWNKNWMKILTLDETTWNDREWVSEWERNAIYRKDWIYSMFSWLLYFFYFHTIFELNTGIRKNENWIWSNAMR